MVCPRMATRLSCDVLRASARPLRRSLLFALLLWLATARTALGEVSPAHAWLSWEAPQESCATAGELRRKLGLLVQRPVRWASRADGGRFGIQVSVLAKDERWKAHVTLRDRDNKVLGTRELWSRFGECRELDVPIALVIATLIDGLWEQLAPQPVSAAGSPAQRAALGASVGAVLGMGDGLWGCAGLRVELPGAWPVALDTSWYPQVAHVDASARGARIGAGHAGVSLCPYLWRNTRGDGLRLCTGLQVGAYWGSGTGLTVQHSRVLPLLLFGVGPALELPLGMPNLSVRASLQGRWAAVRPQLGWSVGSVRGSVQPETLLLGAQISLMGRLP